MNKIVLLKKDGKCKTVSEVKNSDIDSAKYILIPLNCNETHIMLKPNKYLNFTKACICYTIEIVSYEESDDEYCNGQVLKEISVEVDNIIDFYSLLHSINRIEYSNSFLSECDIYNVNEGTYLHIRKLDISLFKGNDKIYCLNIVSKPCLNSFIVEHYDLFGALKPIYTLFRNKGRKYLSIKSNRWRLVDYPEKDSLVGVYLDNTESIYIVPDNILRILSVISSISYRKIIFSASTTKNADGILTLNRKLENEELLTEEDLESFLDLSYIDIFIDSESEIESSRPFDKFGDISPNLQQIIEFFAYVKNAIINNSFIFEYLYCDLINDYLDIITRIKIYLKVSDGKKIVIFLNKNTNISLESIVKLIIRQL